VVVLKKNQIQHEASSSLLQRIKDVIRDNGLFKQDDRVIVGVSGGADSLALLHLLHALDMNLQLIAVYIDHGLRPEEIKREKQTINTYCMVLGVPFMAKQVNVREYAANTKCSIEESARILRHEALENTRTDQHSSLIALAHTADDQVEEFFIRLLRGTSLKGLSGMLFKRDNIIRPLLNESKASLIEYLDETGVTFCHDSSNSDRRFLRNRVRLDLLPKLEKEFNPSIRRTILQNMDILAHDESFLDEVSRDAFEQCVSSGSAADRDTAVNQLIVQPGNLAGFHYSIQRRVIERCFWLLKIKPNYLQIKSLLHFARTAENNSELHLADGVRVTKSRHQVVLSRPLQQGQLRGSTPIVTLSPRPIPGTGSYTIHELGKTLKLSLSESITADISKKGILFIDLDKITFPLLLRSPNPGEYFKPYNAPGKKKILRYLGEKKIDVKKRAGYPILVSGSDVIALPGLEISNAVRVTKATKTRLVIELVDAVC
jgi:tRNA(Ile)-lysidine synthase